jgi:hypothetical protein
MHLKHEGQEGKTGPVHQRVPVGVGKLKGKGEKKVTMIDVLCIYV